MQIVVGTFANITFPSAELRGAVLSLSSITFVVSTGTLLAQLLLCLLIVTLILTSLRALLKSVCQKFVH